VVLAPADCTAVTAAYMKVGGTSGYTYARLYCTLQHVSEAFGHHSSALVVPQKAHAALLVWAVSNNQQIVGCGNTCVRWKQPGRVLLTVKGGDGGLHEGGWDLWLHLCRRSEGVMLAMGMCSGVSNTVIVGAFRATT
jgi:hypothetical protein